MKKLFVSLLAAALLSALLQNSVLAQNNLIPKTINYVLLFKTSAPVSIMKPFEIKTTINAALFEKTEDIERYLINIKNGKKKIKINVNDIIGIYDLRLAKLVNYEIKTEEKIIEKHTVVEEERWNDNYIKILNK